MAPLDFHFASTHAEFEQIHALNYRAFVEEIPQHPPNIHRRLVDRFHKENTYGIGVNDNTVVAMIALRKSRPFSLDNKLVHLDQYLPKDVRLCELRLLYIVPEFRCATHLRGLFELIGAYAAKHRLTMALISGTTRQLKLYRHLGFVPFGPLVGTRQALFQPMYLTLDTAIQRTPWALPSEPQGEVITRDDDTSAP